MSSFGHQRKVHDATVALVDQILAATRADTGSDTSAAEPEIDRHIYGFYSPSLDEIR